MPRHELLIRPDSIRAKKQTENEYRRHTLNELAIQKQVSATTVHNHLRSVLETEIFKKIGRSHRVAGALKVVEENFGNKEWLPEHQKMLARLLKNGPRHKKGTNKGLSDYEKISQIITSKFPTHPRTYCSIVTRAKEMRKESLRAKPLK